MTFEIRLVATMLVLSLLLPALLFAGDNDLLNRDLAEGEAIIHYLCHCGWAVRTSGHLLIFDYWEECRTSALPPKEERTLANGYIDPSEIAGLKVVVFSSHGHRDHYDPAILEWESSIDDINYIFGWKEGSNPKHHYVDRPRKTFELDGLKVYTINHESDGIPESAFLVEVDGLTIYHSGDHTNWRDELSPYFVDNIEYLAGKTDGVDFAFLSTFGNSSKPERIAEGDLLTIDLLQLKAFFPQHDGGREHLLEGYAADAAAKGAKTQIVCVEKRGDAFHYSNGKISPIEAKK